MEIGDGQPLVGGSARPPAMPKNRRDRSWPAIFGSGAVVFGALSIPAGLVGGLAGTLVGMAAPSSGDAPAEAARTILFWVQVGSWATVILSVLLIVAGAGLWRRRAWSIKAVWAWTILNVVLTPVAAVLGVIEGRRTLADLQNGNPDLEIYLSHIDGDQILMVLAICVLLVGWSGPAFLAWWFLRPSIREETAAWR